MKKHKMEILKQSASKLYLRRVFEYYYVMLLIITVFGPSLVLLSVISSVSWIKNDHYRP